MRERMGAGKIVRAIVSMRGAVQVLLGAIALFFISSRSTDATRDHDPCGGRQFEVRWTEKGMCIDLCLDMRTELCRSPLDLPLAPWC